MSLKPGDEFATYRVLSQIGAGGMGKVYQVEHMYLGRRQALKTIADLVVADPTMERRFVNEARAAAGLSHRSIIAIYDFGITDGTPWFTMPLIEGDDLEQEHLTPADVATVVSSVAAGLDYAHRHGVVHRDIKPGNIMVTRGTDGQIADVTILDFGIARLESTRLTAAGIVVGTRAYVSPEVIEGDPATGLSDQYSLAVTAFELLTGELPFPGRSPLALAARSGELPPLISSRRPDLAHADPVLARAMAVDPASRFTDCGTFATALSDALRGPAAHQRPSTRTTEPSADFPAPARQALRTWTTVCVVVRFGEHVLLVRSRHGAHSWGFPSGCVAPGESVPDAAVRHCWEESGLRVGLEGVLRLDHSIDDRGEPHFVTVFAARALDHRVHPRKAPNGHSLGAEWFTLEQASHLATHGLGVVTTISAVLAGTRVFPLSLLAGP
ncbi:protein kinase [Gordonia sp. VNQ95]|uniref:protein kinase domain-containing protein n=1 Tax=Gordonia TaxID=2053 RepID=UPI0032B319EE